jgi:hypothetical protein
MRGSLEMEECGQCGRSVPRSSMGRHVGNSPGHSAGFFTRKRRISQVADGDELETGFGDTGFGDGAEHDVDTLSDCH